MLYAYREASGELREAVRLYQYTIQIPSNVGMLEFCTGSDSSTPRAKLPRPSFRIAHACFDQDNSDGLERASCIAFMEPTER